ncbi:hypothetical protein, partial [Pseudomonas syringae group genomosp. 7]|uniref:hypothetical protein n=1 Tax=Pseudomonas syringae group genomosp. 7 TaxID=251699 RepID=UPI00376FDE24
LGGFVCCGCVWGLGCGGCGWRLGLWGCVLGRCGVRCCVFRGGLGGRVCGFGCCWLCGWGLLLGVVRCVVGVVLFLFWFWCVWVLFV